MRRGITSGLVLTLAAAVAAPATAPAAWNCRASVVRLQVLLPIEPLVANGLPGGVTRPACVADATTLPTIDLPGIRAELLTARTAPRAQAKTSAALVRAVLGGAQITADAVSSQATATCVRGRLRLAGTSGIATLAINDQQIAVRDRIVDLGTTLARIRIGERLRTASSLTVRAASIELLDGTASLVLAESHVSAAGRCAPRRVPGGTSGGGSGGSGSGGSGGSGSGGGTAGGNSGGGSGGTGGGGNSGGGGGSTGDGGGGSTGTGPGSGSGSTSSGPGSTSSGAGAGAGSGPGNAGSSAETEPSQTADSSNPSGGGDGGGRGRPAGPGRVVINGRPPSRCARLRMWFWKVRDRGIVRGRPRRATSRYGTRVVLRGRLTTCAGRPIVGARLDQLHLVRGHWLVKTGLRSRGRGKITLILPNNVATRTIRIAFRRNLRSRRTTAAAVLHLRVVDRHGRIVRR